MEQDSGAFLRQRRILVMELLCENVSNSKLLTIFAKKLHHRCLKVVLNTPLRVYFHSLFILGIILNLEVHIFAKTMFSSIQERI